MYKQQILGIVIDGVDNWGNKKVDQQIMRYKINDQMNIDAHLQLIGY
jgi:hypothetical protein